MQVFFAIVIYICSFAAGLIVLFVIKKISGTRLLVASIPHFVLLAWFMVMNFSPGKSPAGPGLVFLFLVCTGIALSGLAVNSHVTKAVKFYFLLFPATILLFFYSPSRMINFLLTSHYSATTGKVFELGHDYFLEAQSSFISSAGDSIAFKLLKRSGRFHETLQRDIFFSRQPDSVKVISFEPGISVTWRAYLNKENYVASETDSFTFISKLQPGTKNKIERKL